MAALGKQFKVTPSGLWTPRQQKLVVANYVEAYQKTSPEHLEHGAEFYPAWNEDAQHFAQVTGLGTEAGSAILANLSPSKEAEENRLAAYQLVHGVDDKQTSLLLEAGGHNDAATSLQGRINGIVKRGETGSAEHQELLTTLAFHKNQNAALRNQAGIKGTVLGNFGSREISKALRVREGEVEDPLGSLGIVKLRDFGELINDPKGYERAPIDTHIHDAGVGRFDIPYIQKRGIGSGESVNRYEHFQDSIIKAHGMVQTELGLHIPMGDFMGGIWFGHQQRKVEANPDALRARRSSETKLENIRNNPANRWSPESYGMRPSLVKIAT